MHERPIGDLVCTLRRDQAQTIEFLGSDGCLPLRLGGGGLPGGDVTLSASVSSQYVSSLLMSAPYAEKPLTLHIEGGRAVSETYITMTVKLMAKFGVHVEVVCEPGVLMYRVPQGVYQNPGEFEVEADASSATYPLAMGAITNGEVRSGVCHASPTCTLVVCLCLFCIFLFVFLFPPL
jgi:pentafunctional AROM polypeptide